MIKLIIVETYSKPDVYGNRYWRTLLTDTKTGKAVIYSDQTNNAKHHARSAGLDWSEIHHTETSEAIREFNRNNKFLKPQYLNPEQIIAWIKNPE